LHRRTRSGAEPERFAAIRRSGAEPERFMAILMSRLGVSDA